MRVAAIQMVSTRDLRANLAAAEKLLQLAAAGGAELAVLPENFACYGRSDLGREAVQDIGGQTALLAYLQDRARTLRLWLVGGTIPLTQGSGGDADADGDRVYAASCVIDPEGQFYGRYDKIHLFDAQVTDGVGRYQESSYICPGQHPQVVGTPFCKLGLSVCYDLRFPEYFRLLADAGADILIVPAAFTYTTGKAHWEILLRARAIETQCFVVAANQGGWHDSKRRTYGHSMIIDPWGQVLAQREEGEGVVLADLNLDELRDVRRQMPIADHRKF